MTTFQRARSEEQRELRRQAILEAAAAMVAELPVAEISLNELSRRVGLAKSNVLRYFESREAVLLELLDTHWRSWLDRLDLPPGGTDEVARRLTDSLGQERLFCELMSVSAAVLERNISPEVARRHKLNAIHNTGRLGELVATAVPGLSPEGGWNFGAGVLAAVAGIWPLAQPSAAMLCAYEDPALAALRLDFATALYEMLATLLAGAVVRWPGVSN